MKAYYIFCAVILIVLAVSGVFTNLSEMQAKAAHDQFILDSIKAVQTVRIDSPKHRTTGEGPGCIY